MNNKHEILTLLREEFERWEALLAGMSEEQIIAPDLPAGLSLKDVMGHLMTWQQRSIARLEAALHNREPEFPGWPADLDPENEADLDQINAWMHERYHDQPWNSVYQAWRDGFLRLLELGEAIPEKDLLDAGRYPWMEGEPLALILRGSYEHHHEEHLEPLLDWLRRHRAISDAT